MRRVRGSWIRAIVAWLIIGLLAQGGLAAPVSTRIAAMIEQIANHTQQSNSTQINGHLTVAGFDADIQKRVHDWDAFSPVRKIETAYWAAERARPGSGGEDFLAKLARQLANDHPGLRAHPDVTSLLARPAREVVFHSLHEPIPGHTLEPGLKGAIMALAERTDQSNLVRTEDLLYAAGFEREAIYDALRANPGTSRGGALLHALHKLEPGAQLTAARAMAKHVVDELPPPDPQLERFLHESAAPPPPSPATRDAHRARPDARDGDAAPPEPPAVDPRHPGPPDGRPPSGGTSSDRPSSDTHPTVGAHDTGHVRLQDPIPPLPNELKSRIAPNPRVVQPPRRAPSGLSLGGVAMESMPAPAVRSMGVEVGAGWAAALGNILFAAEVGGVVFGEIARPAHGGAQGPIALDYNARRDDGQRASVSVGGTRFSLDVPDWILLPAAAWSAQKEVTVLTGIGTLSNRKQERRCGLVYNYAKTINGTLIGLRLMQADAVNRPKYGDLVMRDGKYLVGTGETAPTAAEVAARATSHAALSWPFYDSYFLTDAGRAMTFSLSEGHVQLSGEPVYKLWSSTSLAEESDANHASFLERVNAAERTMRARLGGRSLRLRNEVITATVIGARAAKARAHKADLEGYLALEDLEDLVHATTVVQVAERDNPLSNPRTIEALNPTVYHAVTRFAQLAAFFRYVQASHPAAWRDFFAHLPGPERAQPRVELPTCVP